MSKWDSLGVEDKVIAILREAAPSREHHHLNPPFLSPYQIAIEFDRRHPNESRQLNCNIGGKGTGEHNSLSSYLAGRLSQNLKNADDEGRQLAYEGAFLWDDHLTSIQYQYQGNIIESSLGDSSDMSIFRIRKEH